MSVPMMMLAALSLLPLLLVAVLWSDQVTPSHVGAVRYDTVHHPLVIRKKGVLHVFIEEYKNRISD